MTVPFDLPDHAYVPGETPRHAEGAFDKIRATAQPGMSAAELRTSDAFQCGLYYLAEGFHWEAHDVLEPVWLALPDDSDEKRLVQGLIQVANGLLKLRMGQPRAAARLHDIAHALLDPIEDHSMGLSRGEIRELLDDLKSAI